MLTVAAVKSAVGTLQSSFIGECAISVESDDTQGLSSPCATADLKAVHGIEPLVAALDSDNTNIRAAAADVLGTAASNNVRVQQDVADVRPDIVQKLLQVC
jgi:hypothetical protein